LDGDQERGRRLVDAAAAHWHGGDVARAQELLVFPVDQPVTR
jgi:hypothetical protein